VSKPEFREQRKLGMRAVIEGLKFSNWQDFLTLPQENDPEWIRHFRKYHLNVPGM
jgi:hypothetical protein